MKPPRKITNKIHAAMEEGTLSYQQVAEAALIFLSEDDVARMAHGEEFFMHEDDEDEDEADEEWTPDNADYCDVGSRHHY
jgi:hypothetical protein